MGESTLVCEGYGSHFMNLCLRNGSSCQELTVVMGKCLLLLPVVFLLVPGGGAFNKCTYEEVSPNKKFQILGPNKFETIFMIFLAPNIVKMIFLGSSGNSDLNVHFMAYQVHAEVSLCKMTPNELIFVGCNLQGS